MGGEMLVILTEEQVISTKQVCRGCLLADRSGLPRWHRGKLSCGQLVDKSADDRPALYKCQMGFSVANIE